VSPAVLLPDGLRWVDAGNAGPFTLEGTRTHIVGRRRVAVVDPGPALDTHVDAVAAQLERERPHSVVLLLTHGHADHSGAAAALAERLGAEVLGAWGGGASEEGGAATGSPPALSFRPLAEGESVETDAGRLVTVPTPGHAREHAAFHWPEQQAVFVGDLLLGTGETTWVGAYPGCVADYLASLDRVERLGPRLLLPAHGGPVPDPGAHIARYRAHRRARIAQVGRALAAYPDASADDLVSAVYGASLPPALADAARASVEVMMAHVRPGGA
jgi:glyoxylase-like metal-dependent hydrolase (beta-lactamase superfamily II)